MKILIYGAEIAKAFFADMLDIIVENGAAYDLMEPNGPEAIAKGSKGHDVIITFFPLDEELINALDASVKGIVVTSIGFDTIDVAAANKRGMLVCNIPDYCTEEVALHTVTLILAGLRNLCEYDRYVRAGKWDNRGMVLGRPRHRLSTLTMGFMGFGRIGRKVAGMMTGFGVKIIAYDPYVPETVFTSMNVERAETPDEIYEKSDILSVCMLLNDETYHLISRDSIAKMKDGVIIVNTARGALFDLESVTEGLKSGKIGAAGIDVWENEPVAADHPILNEDNVTMSTHCAYFSIESGVDLRMKSLLTAIKVGNGETPNNCVNKKALGLV